MANTMEAWRITIAKSTLPFFTAEKAKYVDTIVRIQVVTNMHVVSACVNLERLIPTSKAWARISTVVEPLSVLWMKSFVIFMARVEIV